MHTTGRILRTMGMVTDKSTSDFHVGVFHRVQTDAYLIAEKDGCWRDQKEYWEMAKKHVAMIFRFSLGLGLDPVERVHEYRPLIIECFPITEHLKASQMDKVLQIVFYLILVKFKMFFSI